MSEITTHDLTEATPTGGGVFDVLMRSAKSHLEQEYTKGRIKGTEYAEVYLGTMTAVMQQSIAFLLEKDRAMAQVALLAEQAETERKQQALLSQQTANLLVEADNLVKQGHLLDKQALLTGAQTAQTEQQTLNLKAEALNIPRQGILLDAQAALTGVQKLQVESQTALIQQQTLNAVKEGEKLNKEICKLEAEFDVLMETKLKTVAESALLDQKIITERAQTVGAGVDTDSFIGRQKALYQAQADGFVRDAEQKAAKILVDTWNVRRTTDEGTSANTTNKLDDATVGRVINKLLGGVNALIDPDGTTGGYGPLFL